MLAMYDIITAFSSWSGSWRFLFRPYNHCFIPCAAYISYPEAETAQPAVTRDPLKVGQNFTNFILTRNFTCEVPISETLDSLLSMVKSMHAGLNTRLQPSIPFGLTTDNELLPLGDADRSSLSDLNSVLVGVKEDVKQSEHRVLQMLTNVCMMIKMVELQLKLVNDKLCKLLSPIPQIGTHDPAALHNAYESQHSAILHELKQIQLQIENQTFSIPSMESLLR